MTHPLFYDNPLSASWMADAHGMNFYTIEPDGSHRRIEARYASNPLNFYRDQQPIRAYVAEDSLWLLEARDGDAVEFDRWHWDRQRHEDLKDALPQPHFALVKIDGDWKHIFSSGIGWDRARLNEPFGLPFRIIQRNGLAFHSPEAA